MKQALVIGATGLVGAALLRQLLDDSNYNEVTVFVRRSVGYTHPKLREELIDFADVASWHDRVRGDVLFSTLGTTIAVAKTKDKQYEVDFTYQYNFAKAAAENGVPTYVLISSAGANATSLLFYQNMKGELEEAVRRLPFRHCVILRPAQLAGNRLEKRTGERIGLAIGGFLTRIGLLRNYRPIDDSTVAAAMRAAAALSTEGVESYTAGELFRLAGNAQ